ncbi:hypothetical protein LTR17_010325 [Elasticomyces elasticus]|nr:hypothetical protein LTR17_010325 [Elasticomyces elasticus]
MAAPTPTLMGLPAELRLIIHGFVLVKDQPITLMYTASCTPEPHLLRVNKKIREEALPIYYQNTFEGTVGPLSKVVRNLERHGKIKIPKQLRLRQDGLPGYGSLQAGTKSRWLRDFGIKRDEILKLRAGCKATPSMDVSIQFPLRHTEAGLVRGTIEELDEHDVVDRDGKKVWVRARGQVPMLTPEDFASLDMAEAQ